MPSLPSSTLNTLLQKVRRPGRYLGNEVNVIKKDFDQAELRVCLVFPDKYEVGMSHIGLKILYDILNQLSGVVCERCYAPELDLEEELRKGGIPLFSLESCRPLSEFDLVGFSLTYELTYTNMLNVLDLGRIPIWQKDRGMDDPLVIAGGGCTMNAEPVADFLDAACLGDGEELILDVVEAVRRWKRESWIVNRGSEEKLQSTIKDQRSTLLNALSQIEGIYVPSFFEPEYNPDGTLARMKPLKEGCTRIKKRIVSDLDRAPYPTAPLVPAVKTVHDRIGIEIQRGCNRACRFCQAGYIDRPVRQRSPKNILKIAEESYRNTGMEDISLLSLSAADYACLVPLLAELNKEYADRRVSLSVPATRTEKMTPELVEEIKKVRKTGFTIAPEAGSERMRRVINKGNKVDDLWKAVEVAFSAGWQLLKLYYMVGLPFETDEDLIGIAKESMLGLEIARKYTRRAELTTSLSSFVPKPHTPFQWEPQMTIDQTRQKYDLVRRHLRGGNIRLKHHHAEMSYLEGIFSRGDRRVSGLIDQAWKEGCRFDEWEEHFDFPKWEKAIQNWGLDPSFYLHRRRSRDEVLPWDHLFCQMDKEFLWEEFEKARKEAFTQHQGFSPSESGDRPSHHDSHGISEEVPVPGAGFTEDCSVARCSDCGVCDFRGVKNRIYVPGEQPVMVKKGNREWYGWDGSTSSPCPISSSDQKRADILSLSKDGGNNDLSLTQKLRCRFSKTGEAKFLGHLEIMGIFRRAINRSGLPVCYSEGFHPQMKISFGPPLAVGIESDWEFFDLELNQEVDPSSLKDQLNQRLPQGIRVLVLERVDRKSPSIYSSIDGLGYEVTPQGGDQTWSSDIYRMLCRFQEGENFYWLRRKEEKIKKFHLNQWVRLKLDRFPASFSLQIRLTEEGSLRPQEVVEALLLSGEPKGCFKKTAVFWK